MKVNKNVIMIKEDTKVGGMLLEAGDAFVRLNGRWTIVEADDEGSAEDEKEDEKEMNEEEDEGSAEDEKEDKKEESKKRK